MSDVHSKEIRSYNMSQIKSKDTKPELLVRKYLFANGLRFRIHDNKLPGKPDIFYKTGHKGYKYLIVPKTRKEWWRNKIENTAQGVISP